MTEAAIAANDAWLGEQGWQVMADALRTIASGRKDFGEPIADQHECEQIALNTLEKIGLYTSKGQSQ